MMITFIAGLAGFITGAAAAGSIGWAMGRSTAARMQLTDALHLMKVTVHVQDRETAVLKMTVPLKWLRDEVASDGDR